MDLTVLLIFMRGPDSNYTPGSVPASCYQSGGNSTTSSCSLLPGGNSSSTACPGPDEVWSSGCLAASLLSLHHDLTVQIAITVIYSIITLFTTTFICLGWAA